MGHKSLHESAAEILAASVAAAGKEPVPMTAMMNPPADLGGEMPTGDVVSPGAATAQTLEASPKAGRPGAPAEEIKTLAAENEEEAKEEDPNKLMEGLIAEHGPELVLENLITEYGDKTVFSAIMEEYTNEYGSDVVAEKLSETLSEQYDDETIAQFVVESVASQFGEQEFTDEEFESLLENSNAFITEMDALSEEDFDKYISSLNEEEIINAIQLASINEGFLKKIGKALKKGVKAVGKVAGKVLSNPILGTIASVALPGVGSLAAGLGSKLASTALGKAVGAVGSKIAGSALGKGVAALGKTALGGALKNVAGEAIKGGVGSVLTGGKFKEGAKAGGLGAVAGMAGNALGQGISNLTGSQKAGELASNIASAKLQGGSATQAAADTLASRDDSEEVADTSAQTKVAATKQKPAYDEEDETDSKEGFSKYVRKQPRAMAAEEVELMQHLSSLNEEQLEQFVSELSDEDATVIADMLEEATAADVIKRQNDVLRSNLLKTSTKPKDFSASIEAQNKVDPLLAGRKNIGAQGSYDADVKKYGKTGAEIIKLGGMEAYKKRPKDKEGNLKYLASLKGNKPAAAAAAAPAATKSVAAPAATAPVAAAKPAAAAVSARPTAPAADSGLNPEDYASYWEKNPIKRTSVASDSESMGQSEQPEKSYGDQVIDSTKRILKTGAKTAIGGALLGQEWEKAGRAGMAGQAASDIWNAFKSGYSKKSKQQQGMNESIEDSNMNGEETTMETTELTEEQIREERMLAIKEAVKQFKGNMREDVDALFNGESLSEEFRAKATLIFESAVTSRVESILEEIVAQNDEVLANAYEEIKDQLTEQVDEYLNYVVEQWMEENQVAVETGLRAELAEDFISGLRSLFQEHYIEIPEEKVDVAETLAAELGQAAEYVETVHQHVAQQDETIASLQEQLNAVKKEKAVNAFCEGLTAVQAGKMKALAEGVEFTTEGDFEEKLAVLRENYFPTKVQVKSEVKELQQVALNEEPEVAQTNNVMNRYVQAIAKTAPKA